MQRHKVVIDRNRWARVVDREIDSCTVREGTEVRTADDVGKRSGLSPRLLRENGTMCCLGFVCRALLSKAGLEDDLITPLLMRAGMPESVCARAGDISEAIRCQVAEALQPLSDRVDMVLAVRLNDLDELRDAMIQDRERRLANLLAKHGIDLEFTGEQDPRELPPTQEGENNATA